MATEVSRDGCEMALSTTNRFDLTFPAGAMGFGMETPEDSRQGSFVTVVVPNSEAMRQGVQLGDELVAIADWDVTGLDHMEVVELISTVPRPVILHFERNERGQEFASQMPSEPQNIDWSKVIAGLERDLAAECSKAAKRDRDLKEFLRDQEKGHRAIHELSALQKEMQALKKDHVEQLAAKDKQILTLKKMHRQVASEKTLLRAELSARNKTIESLEKQIEEGIDRLKQRDRLVSRLERDKKAQQDDITRLLGEIETREKEIESLKCLRAEENKKLVASDEQLKAMVEQKDQHLFDVINNNSAGIESKGRIGKVGYDRVLKKYEGKSDPPSIEAAKKGDLESMRILASAGHNVAKIVVNRYGETPLHHVAFGSDNVAFAKFLLSNTHNKSSLLNAKTNSGITALHWAAQTNHYKLVAFLLASGADHTAKTQYGNTALDVAVAMESVESVNILKKRYNCLKTGGSGEGKRDVSQI